MRVNLVGPDITVRGLKGTVTAQLTHKGRWVGTYRRGEVSGNTREELQRSVDLRDRNLEDAAMERRAAKAEKANPAAAPAVTEQVALLIKRSELTPVTVRGKAENRRGDVMLITLPDGSKDSAGAHDLLRPLSDTEATLWSDQVARVKSAKAKAKGLRSTADRYQAIRSVRQQQGYDELEATVDPETGQATMQVCGRTVTRIPYWIDGHVEVAMVDSVYPWTTADRTSNWRVEPTYTEARSRPPAEDQLYATREEAQARVDAENDLIEQRKRLAGLVTKYQFVWDGA